MLDQRERGDYFSVHLRAGMGEDRPEMQLEKDSKDRQEEIHTTSRSLDHTSHLDYHKIQL